MSTTRTFRYEEVDIDHISAIELCEEFEHAKHAQLFHIIVYPHGVDEPPISERADALYLPEVG